MSLRKPYKDISETVFRPTSDEELMEWHRARGRRIVRSRGKIWVDVGRGFYQPVHWLAEMHANEIQRPSAFCWGFRACLAETDAHAANASIPVHVLDNLERYEIEYFDHKLRSHIRRFQSRATIVELTSPELLLTQGYEVVTSAVARAAYRTPPTRESYLAQVAGFLQPGRLVLATLVGGKMLAYASGFAVNGTAYCEEQFISNEALPLCAGAGMTYEFIQLCRRSGEIKRVVSGLHAREDAGLCRFKKHLGFSVRFLPAKAWVFHPVKTFLRWRMPHKYYRLTGDGRESIDQEWKSFVARHRTYRSGNIPNGAETSATVQGECGCD